MLSWIYVPLVLWCYIQYWASVKAEKEPLSKYDFQLIPLYHFQNEIPELNSNITQSYLNLLKETKRCFIILQNHRGKEEFFLLILEQAETRYLQRWLFSVKSSDAVIIQTSWQSQEMWDRGLWLVKSDHVTWIPAAEADQGLLSNSLYHAAENMACHKILQITPLPFIGRNLV